MFKIIKNVIYIISFIVFIILITFFYFSEKNIISTNKSRSLYFYKLSIKLEDLPLIKNDTNDVIEYSNDIEDYKKNKKTYIFWDLIK